MLLTASVYALEPAQLKPAKHALGFSAGWVNGSGITYRRYFGDHFAQGTIFGLVSNNGNDAYVDAAFSVGTYLSRLESFGILPPMGLKLMAGADLVIDRTDSSRDGFTTGSFTYDRSYYGGGVALEFGNPGSSGLSLWAALNYVFTYDGIGSPSFQTFDMRPSMGILYGWK
ncbi:MAG: hypothetical protein OEZ43_12405 [Gammaproteobacteria bacterium]|nr:hypothetical protein [Gammaproteobacteria bacterium]